LAAGGTLDDASWIGVGWGGVVGLFSGPLRTTAGRVPHRGAGDQRGAFRTPLWSSPRRYAARAEITCTILAQRTAPSVTAYHLLPQAEFFEKVVTAFGATAARLVLERLAGCAAAEPDADPAASRCVDLGFEVISRRSA
jgi:hypothetical protein